MCAEEEATKEPLLEEDELNMVYDVNAISRSEISVLFKIQNNNIYCSMQLDTGCALSLLLMGRRLCTRLELLIPSVEKHVEARQYSSMVNPTAKRGLHHFRAGDAVLAQLW